MNNRVENVFKIYLFFTSNDKYCGFAKNYNLHVKEISLTIFLSLALLTNFLHCEKFRQRTCFHGCQYFVCSLGLLPHSGEWRVDGSITGSDHNAIVLGLDLAKPTIGRPKSGTRKYSTKKANWDLLRETFIQTLLDGQVTVDTILTITDKHEMEEMVQKYVEAATKACDESIPRLKPYRGNCGLPWWTEELETMRKGVNTKRRRVRWAAPNRRPGVVRLYLEAKEEYEAAVVKAQTTSWKTFCTRQDRESLWDGIYRVIRRATTRKEDQLLMRDGRALDPEQSVKWLAATFYPTDDRSTEDSFHAEVRREVERAAGNGELEEDDQPFTRAELLRVVRTFSVRKAPGPDGFTADICHILIDSNPECFLELVNGCLRLACFPKQWKEAAVVVLRKPGRGDYDTPRSYRPIGLLSILGKILEKLMIGRLKYHLLPGINPRQYGFVPQRSTEDALYDLRQHVEATIKNKKIALVVSLDIEGAFDNAWWPAIKSRLITLRCPANLMALVNSYLDQRTVVVHYAGVKHRRETEKGCVQGSIGGPLFWNLLLDTLIVELQGLGAYVQAFADDVVLVFSGDSSQIVQSEANRTLAHVHKWGHNNKLKFAPAKTKGMVLTRKLKFDTPRVNMGGVPIEIVDEMKILGLIIDRKLNFKSHISAVCKKATGIYKQLAKTAKIEWGLNPEVIKTIYVAVVEPVILYAASVWAPAAERSYVRNQLGSVQRGFALKISKAYRTVSLNAALVLSGLLPLDLRVAEAARLYECKRGRPIVGRSRGQLEGRISFMELPHPADELDITFECLQPQNIVDLHLPDDLIFTDGSKIEGMVGAAYAHWRNGREIRTKKMRLESFCTVFQAELLAILQSVELILQSRLRTAGIMSDSRSALELVRDHNALHPLAFAIRRGIAKIRESGREVKLFWVKAHVGISGNERADELAKQAALNNRTAAQYDAYPVATLKRGLRAETTEEWNTRYNRGSTASVTKLFFPNCGEAYKIIKKMKLTPDWVQALTGHGGFAAYLHKFKRKDDPKCDCAVGADQTIQHLIFECMIYCKERNELENELGREVNESTLCEIMKDKKERKALEKFVLPIVKKTKLKNKGP